MPTMTTRDEYGGGVLLLFECVALMRQAIDGSPLTCPACGEEGFYGLPITQPSTHYVCTSRRHFYRVDEDIKNRAWAIVDADVPPISQAVNRGDVSAINVDALPSSEPEPVEVVPALQFRCERMRAESTDISTTATCSICHREWLKVYGLNQWYWLWGGQLCDMGLLAAHVQSHLA